MTHIAYVQSAKPDRSDLASIASWCRKMLSVAPHSRPQDPFRREEAERSMYLDALREESRRSVDRLLL